MDVFRTHIAAKSATTRSPGLNCGSNVLATSPAASDACAAADCSIVAATAADADNSCCCLCCTCRIHLAELCRCWAVHWQPVGRCGVPCALRGWNAYCFDSNIGCELHEQPCMAGSTDAIADVLSGAAAAVVLITGNLYMIQSTRLSDRPPLSPED